jgi:cell division protein FtsI/penicillin-binding protein 2
MKLIERRVGLLSALFLLAFALVLGRAAWIQAVQGGELRADARNQQLEVVEIPADRGSILDRRGRELAVSEPAATIFATPNLLDDPVSAAKRLAKALDRSPREVLNAIADRESGFAYVARDVDLVAAERVRELGIEGVGIIPDSRRVYPQGPLAAQLVGAVGTEEQGLYGLEASSEDLLKGVAGKIEVTKDGLGEEIERNTQSTVESGRDLTLTIDARLQAGVEEVLNDVGERYEPAGATAILMDPQTSEVLALANWPEADPANAANEPAESFRNRATAFTYEPGSTFKAFTVGAALSDDVVKGDTVFDLPSTLQVADREIEEAVARPPISLNVAQILAQSSNVGAVKIGLKLGAKRFDRWVHRFGFGKAGADIPSEQGIVPRHEEYSGSSMGNLPIGQGLSVTPLQMISGYAAIANGGVFREPSLLLDKTQGPRPGRRILTEKTAAGLSEMLEGVFAPGGTAASVSVPGYSLAGKTGTAEKVVDGVYSETDFVASFIGFAPAKRPRLVVAVVVDEPAGGVYSGSEVAAPAFGQIMSFALPELGVEQR